MPLVPGCGRDGVVAEHVHVHEVVVHRALHLDRRVVGTIQIHEEVPIARARTEQLDAVGENRLKGRPQLHLPDELRLHVFGAPADVEERRDDFGWRRLLHLGEQQPRALCPDSVFAIERGSIR